MTSHGSSEDPNQPAVDTGAASVGQIPSGLFIVCAQSPESGGLEGYLASWVQQVSFEPLMISLAIKPGRPACDPILQGHVFTVNVIGDHDNAYMEHFWSGYDPEDNPFHRLALCKGRSGGMLLEAAKSAMECRLHSSTQPGDHLVVIARVLNCYLMNDLAQPLVHIRETGLSY
jgi:flavin reductase (DIM6/NTAB) family NADH-FMN oxidoreductase RutF